MIVTISKINAYWSIVHHSKSAIHYEQKLIEGTATKQFGTVDTPRHEKLTLSNPRGSRTHMALESTRANPSALHFGVCRWLLKRSHSNGSLPKDPSN